MKIADHSYAPNGLGAINDEGWVPCAHCGHARSVHATEAVTISGRHRHRFGGLTHEHPGGEVDHSHNSPYDRGGWGPVESWAGGDDTVTGGTDG